jgi:hypothetical protein
MDVRLEAGADAGLGSDESALVGFEVRGIW